MLEEFLLSLGYQDDQIKTVRRMIPSTFSEATILYNFKNLYHYFRRNGMDNKDFIHITMTTPTIIMNSLEMIKVRIEELNGLGFHKLEAFSMIKEYPYLLELSIAKIKNKMEKFLDLSFPKENVIHLLSSYPVLFRMEPVSFKKKFDFFIEFGYREKEAISILTRVPQLFEDSISTVQNKIHEFQKIGFSSMDIIHITSFLPELFIYSTSLIQEMFNDLTEFGYSELDEIQMIKKVPMILKDYYFEQINSRLDFLTSIGFSREEIVFITCNNPYVFFYSNDAIQSKIEAIGKCGYLLQDILKMLKEFPLLFGYDAHTIQEKIDVLKENNLDDLILEDARYLFFPLELLQKRISFLKSKNIELREKDQSFLFLEDIPFHKKYKVTKEELLKGEY